MPSIAIRGSDDHASRPPLSALESTIFPCSPATPASPRAPPTIVPLPCHLGLVAGWHQVPAESLAQLAWAVVLGHYLGSRAPSFGFLALRDDEAASDYAAAVPLTPGRLDCVGAVLDREASLSSMIRAWSSSSRPRPADAVFNTAVVVGTGALAGGTSRYAASAQVPVVAIVDLSSPSSQLAVSCEPRAVGPEQQMLVAHALRAAFEALMLRPGQRLGDVDLFTAWDHQMIASWNRRLPVSVDSCIHHKVADAARRAPEAPAICAWDGDLTYARLQGLSTRLASWLQAQKPAGGLVVALHFFKSRWAVVAMLAVVKAGGTFVSLDPTHPKDRQRLMAEDAGASVTLVAEELAAEAHTSTNLSLVVSQASMDGLPDHGPDALKDLSKPHDAAYIVYTSGSTGSPKGVVVEHAALCTAVDEQAAAMDIGPGSRVLQFAAYTFDVSIGDIFTALTHGACLCIPSEAARRDDLARTMAEMGVSHACLTSTVAALLDPADLPRLRTLTLGGEPVSRHNVAKWAAKVRLNNIYGPVECTVWCFMQPSLTAGVDESKIGHGIGARGWIAHPDDSERLMPVGAVGELLVEGPLLARGYLNSEDKTAASFIVEPSWLHMFAAPGRRRLYKTGDLVRYDAADGALIFVGRKDTQVKLRGQRIELGEIEHHLLLGLGGSRQVAVDVVEPPAGGDAVLAAFISVDAEPGQKTISADVKTLLAGLVRQARPLMAQALPSYMMPVVFVPVRAMPLTVSGKTDRRRLRQLCSQMSWPELLSIVGSEPGQPPTGEASREATAKTPAEAQMAEAWAKLLGVAAADIRPEDGFVSLGGDSLKAIYLVAIYRSMGLTLSVADILQNPSLSGMAACVAPAAPSGAPEPDAADYAITTASDKRVTDFAEQCGVSKEAITAVYPCTPLQEDMMEMSLHGLRTQFAHELTRLWPSLNLERFKGAWECVFRLHPILRTRFVRDGHDGSLKQVVVDEELQWETPSDFDSYMAQHFGHTLRPGARLARWGLCRETVAEQKQKQLGGHGQSRMLIISMHHSILDAITLRRIFDDVYKAYQGHQLAHDLPDFGRYLGRLRADIKRREHGDFWRSYLAGWEESRPFPDVPSPDYRPQADKGAVRYLFFELGEAYDLGHLTTSTLLRGSWSLFLAKKTASRTVVFSTFLAGRNADVPGIEQLVAPTFVHVPIRATVSPGQTVFGFLQGLQDDAIAMIPFEGTGMRAIRGTSDAARVIRNLLVIQPMPGGGGKPPSMPGEDTKTFPGHILCGPRADAAAMGAFNPYPLLVECVMQDAGIGIRVSFDDAVLSAPEVDEMLDDFGATIRSLAAQLHGPVPVPVPVPAPAPEPTPEPAPA